ncbi:unnamed protein product [Caenorhabditis brenneri]
MAEFLKNNPNARRHYFQYDYFRNNQAEEASEVFRKKIRGNACALRACVLYESIQYQMMVDDDYECLWPHNILKIKQNPSRFMYDNSCKVVGKDAMKYKEFDFWFYRFFNGEFDLDFEIDKDKKIYELVDMPIDIMKNILDYLYIFDWFALTQTSQSFKTFVEDQKLFHEFLEVTIENSRAYILYDDPFSFNNRQVHFYTRYQRLFPETGKFIQGLPYWKPTMMELESVLKLPNLHLEVFRIGSDALTTLNEAGKALEAAFKLIQQLHVKHFSIDVYSMQLILNILPSLKPGYLTTINLFFSDSKPCHFEKLVKMEQWKQAKYFTTGDYSFFAAPLHHLYHFKEFHVHHKELLVEDIRQMKEILFKSPEFEKCIIRISFENPFDVDAIRREFGDAVQEDPMAELLKNNPIALRHCLLYQFLRHKSIEEAFDDFCETVGNDVINKEEFQYWFHRFEQGKFDKKKKPLADMREVLRNDKKALRACVMYEWLSTKNMEITTRMKSLYHENRAFSPFTEYKNFCKVIGNNVMGYKEFEFWFYRFENGEFDLKFKRDKNNKRYELVDMPIDIMKNVVKYLNIVDRVSLAKTSRSFKTFVENEKSFQKKLDFFINDRTATISCEPRFIVYENRGHHWKQALQDLRSILKYPKLHLETISCQLDMPIRIETSLEVESLNKAFYALDTLKSIQQLPVKKVSLKAYTLDKLLIFIRFLKPGYLTTIDIFVDKPDDEATEKLFQMEQWKQAKYFYMSDSLQIAGIREVYN